MAGQGKGALRIALEDFATTTKIGQWLFSWYTDFIEGFESGIANEFMDIFEEISKIPELAKIFNPAKFKSKSGQHQGAGAALLGFGMQVGNSAASAFLAPFMKLLNYGIDKRVYSARIEPTIMIQHRWKVPESKVSDIDDSAELGFTPDRVKYIQEAMQPLMDLGSLNQLYLRGEISQSEYTTRIAQFGFSGNDAGLFEKLTQVIPGVQDLISMAVREAWNEPVVQKFEYDAELPAEAAEWTKKQGLSADWFKRYWRAHWQLISASQGFEMMHRLRPDVSDVPFTEADMSLLLKTADYPHFFRDRLIKIAYNPYTRVDVRRMYKLKILNETDVYNSYRDLGYDDEHAKNMTAFTVQYETATDTTKVDKARDLNQGTITDAYKKKIIDRAKAEELLRRLVYDDEEIKIIMDAADFRAVVAAKPDYTDTLMNDLRNLINKAYTTRMLSKDEATTMLAGLNYSPDEITLLLSNADFEYDMSVLNETLNLMGKAYLKGELTYDEVVNKLGTLNITGAMQTQLFNEWQLQINYRSDKLSESQYRSAAIKKIISEVEYRDAVKGLGYSDKNIELLVKLYLTEPATTTPV
jgi:hypothetical protein